MASCPKCGAEVAVLATACTACGASVASHHHGWLSTIEGTVPGVGQAVAGCSFAPRCHLARAECAAVPPLRGVGPGHQAACVVPMEELGL